MSTMMYKGYSARVDYDDRDHIFVGHVLGVRDSISFHGETVGALRTDFRNAIDLYLAVCAKRKESPDKPYSGKLMLRVPPEVHAAAAIAAEVAGESLNQWATQALQSASAATGQPRVDNALRNATFDPRPARDRSTARKTAPSARRGRAKVA